MLGAALLLPRRTPTFAWCTVMSPTDSLLLQTASWDWYYPYHFAPFAADFTDVANMDIKFELGAPAKPFEQLMSVFPAARYGHPSSSFSSFCH